MIARVSRRISERNGFTLLELMVAIVISGLIALLAYGAITAGLSTLERVEEHRRNAQSRALARPMITDALRHIADAGATTENVFQIQRTSAEGLPSLVFLTRGVESPMGASSLWKMTLATSRRGLTIDAVALEDVKQSPISTVIPGVNEIRLRLLPTRNDQAWVTNWESPRQHPYAVKIEMLDSLGQIIEAPLVVAPSIESTR